MQDGHLFNNVLIITVRKGKSYLEIGIEGTKELLPSSQFQMSKHDHKHFGISLFI